MVKTLWHRADLQYASWDAFSKRIESSSSVSVVENVCGNGTGRAHSTGSDQNPSQSLTSDNPYMRYCVCPNPGEGMVSAPCSSGTLNHHGVIRTLRITGWELNAKTVDGIANKDLKMTW